MFDDIGWWCEQWFCFARAKHQTHKHERLRGLKLYKINVDMSSVMMLVRVGKSCKKSWTVGDS